MDEESNLLLVIQRAREDCRQVQELLLGFAGKFPAASAESMILDYLDHPFARMEQRLSRAEDYLKDREFHAGLTDEAEAA